VEDEYNPMVLALAALPVPVVVGVNGACAGAGLGIALAADLRVAAAGAKFTTAFTGIGLSSDSALAARLVRCVGASRASELLLLPEPFLAETAAEWGLVHRVVEPERVQAEALALATRLLQRARLADPMAGLWEAADVQWWSRKARPSDALEQVFWCDDHGPIAGVLLTCWGEDAWQCDPISVPSAASPALDVIWAAAVGQIREHAAGDIEVPVSNDQRTLKDLVAASGLVAGQAYGIAWMDAADRPPVLAPGDGFVLTDRTHRRGTRHPMRHRNGDGVEERLSRCSLYIPSLDLAVETIAGQPAGYTLCWFDPVTRVGLIEPVRVEDQYARRGLARAMLTAGIDRLVRFGAERIKIGFGSPEAADLYQGIGFRPTSRDAWFEGQVEHLR
jgi:enoyl-CoA hydratase/carnithine racemase